MYHIWTARFQHALQYTDSSSISLLHKRVDHLNKSASQCPWSLSPGFPRTPSFISSTLHTYYCISHYSYTNRPRKRQQDSKIILFYGNATVEGVWKDMFWIRCSLMIFSGDTGGMKRSGETTNYEWLPTFEVFQLAIAPSYRTKNGFPA